MSGASISSTLQPIIIVGAGHGGVQAAASLREEGYDGPVILLSSDKHPPYQRPPLSKAFLRGEAVSESLILRGEAFYRDNAIDLRLGATAARIDRATKRLYLADGDCLSYRHLILATGAIPRNAPFSGAELRGVCGLRDLDDAQALLKMMSDAHDIVVIGAGFIGLEFAATAAKAGATVQLVEVASRVMGRAVSSEISDFYAAAHRALGVKLHLGVGVAAIEGRDGAVTAVLLTDGRRLRADCVLVGIGVLANERLAAEAGLTVADGVVVDAAMTSSDPTISAIGDCAAHPNAYAKRVMRLESVQNAVDQARVVARKITGKPSVYDSLPWFWSDQGDLKLQIAGLIAGGDRFIVRGDPAMRSFSVFTFAGDSLIAVETVNRPGDHMAARRILSERIVLTSAQAEDCAFDLKACAMRKIGQT